MTQEDNHSGRTSGGACRQYCIKKEFANAKSSELNIVAERALDIIQTVGLAARNQAPLVFSDV